MKKNGLEKRVVWKWAGQNADPPGVVLWLRSGRNLLANTRRNRPPAAPGAAPGDAAVTIRLFGTDGNQV